MTTEHETAALRRKIEALGAVKQKRRYDDDLRRRLVAHARERAADGEPLTAIARSLDVSVPTMKRLLASTPSLLPVKVSTPTLQSRLVVRGRCGVVIEASVDEVAALLMRLSCLA
jgi:hypothetical protein